MRERRRFVEDRQAVCLDAATVEAIARRVAEILAADLAVNSGLVGAGEVAKRLGVSRAWVYENAERLGAVRLGTGTKSRLRFDPARVADAVRDLSTTTGRAGRPAARRSTKWLDDGDLIPIRGALTRPR